VEGKGERREGVGVRLRTVLGLKLELWLRFQFRVTLIELG